MKKFGLILLSVFFLTTGCRSYYYKRVEPDGTVHKVWIQSCFGDMSLSKLQFLVDTNAVISVEGYAQDISEESVKAITEGVVEGVGKLVVPKP